MPAPLSYLAAWRELQPPVRIGAPAPGTLTVGELATEHGYQLVTAAMAALGLTRRSVQLAPLHLANWATMELLARPVFTDGVWIAASAHQLGFVIDEHGDMPELWLAAEAPARPCPRAPVVGASIGGLLGPVAGMVTRCSRIHQRAVTTIAAESAIAGLFRTARAAGHPDDARWLDEASATVAKALGARVTSERMCCRPDEGPTVALPARSLCCVLNPKTSCHSCPGCPKTGNAAEREQGVTRWLASMDDEEFLETTGRPRHERVTADDTACDR